MIATQQPATLRITRPDGQTFNMVPAAWEVVQQLSPRVFVSRHSQSGAEIRTWLFSNDAIALELLGIEEDMLTDLESISWDAPLIAVETKQRGPRFDCLVYGNSWVIENIADDLKDFWKPHRVGKYRLTDSWTVQPCC